MEFEDLQTFIKRQKEKKQHEREERKQRKIDHYFKKIKKEKDVNENMVHYDGDDSYISMSKSILHSYLHSNIFSALHELFSLHTNFFFALHSFWP